jgi:uncharacterized membrane protein
MIYGICVVNISTGRRTVLLYSLAMLVALVGLADSIYLTVQHLTGRSARCTISNTCSKVLSSQYATLAGIPTATYGVIAYFTAFCLSTMVVFGYLRCRNWLAALVGLMFVASLWFLSLQAFVIRAYCDFCLLSAATTFTLAGIVLADRYLPVENRAGH